MDKITVAVVANKIQGGGFGGLLNVPVFKGKANNSDEVKPEDCFRYEAKIISTDAGEIYEFAVQPGPDTMKMDIVVGKAIIKPTSSVKVTYKEDKFTVLANLSGRISVDGNLGANTKLHLPDLVFEEVKISNVQPYFQGGNFSIPWSLGAQIGGFGLTISGPQLIPGDSTSCNFRVGADITLVGDGNGDAAAKLNFGAATAVVLEGTMVTVNNRQRWKYKDYSVQKIAINASFKGVDGIKGEIEWYKNDPVFGKGFRGRVAMQISGLKKSGGGLGLEALAQFGKKDDYKYFFVDALASLNPGIDLGGLAIRGFGGGVYYHMTRDSATFAGLDNAPTAYNQPSALGVSLSGIKYSPDHTIGLGIKATIIVATTKEEVFNGGATFEIRFNDSASGGGIKDIALYGSARMMAPIQFGSSALFNSAPSKEAPVAANFSISYVFATKTLHGELAVFVNVEDAFSGAGSNYLAGKAVLHFDPDKWYINVGTPSEPVAVRVSIPVGGSSGGDLFTVKAYFCVGTGIPSMPPLPPYVQQMTGAGNFMTNESRRASGKGFALGASVEISTGNLEFLIFYGQLDLGLGFDIMLQKYDSVVCSNNDNKPLGINGWYASGQAWAYINAELGIKVGSKKYAIMDIGAAAALQAKLPNPFWARGAVGGEYRILGGLIKGNCNFKFTIGKNCNSGDDNSIKIIEDIDPADKSDLVEVNLKPTAYFSIPVNGKYSTFDNDGNEISHDVVLKYARLTNSATGSLVNGQLVYSSDKRQLVFKTPTFLPGNTSFRFEVCAESKINSIVELTEVKTITFTTAEEPTTIPVSNIAAAYPLNGMYNLYRNETANGFINLKDGQPALLDAAANLEVHFSTQAGGLFAKVPVQISNGYKNISFVMPAALQSNTIYRMDLMKIEGGVLQAKPEGPQHSTANNPGESATEAQQFRSIYNAFFRTSTYNKFADKIAYFKSVSTASGNNGNMTLSATIEPFDALELIGTGTTPALIPIVEPATGFVQDIINYYAALREIDNFKPYGTSNLPTGAISCTINGVDSMYRITSDIYNSGIAPVASASVVLKNIIFGRARTDFEAWALKKKLQIINECDFVGATDLYTTDCFADMIHYGPVFVPPSGGHCCESVTLSEIINHLGPLGIAVQALYQVLGTVTPEPNSLHEFSVGYRLPNGVLTFGGTTIQFKYSN